MPDGAKVILHGDRRCTCYSSVMGMGAQGCLESVAMLQPHSVIVTVTELPGGKLNYVRWLRSASMC